MCFNAHMEARYELHPDNEGWSVIDRLTARAADVSGVCQRGLGFDEADRLLQRLNRLSGAASPR
jgi:hypothetical protein